MYLSLIVMLVAFPILGLAQKAVPLKVVQDNSDNIHVRRVVEYSDILGPMATMWRYLEKESLKTKLHDGCHLPAEKDPRAEPFRYACDEYPFGNILPDGSKQLMQKDAAGNFNPVTVYYRDKRKNRSMQIPIKMERAMRTASYKELMLKPTAPGVQEVNFQNHPRLLGDTLVSTWVEKEALYTSLCQYFPGTAIYNDHFAGTYTYYYKKIKYVGTISSSLDFSGRIGGIRFDAIRICALMKADPLLKTVNLDGTKGTTLIEILPPQFINLDRIDFEMNISGVSWVKIILLAVLVSVVLAVIPGLLGSILSTLGTVVTVVIALVAIADKTNLLDKFANKYVDDMVKEKYGVSYGDFSDPDWANKIKNLQLSEPSNEADMKNGNWAKKTFTQSLMKPNILAAMQMIRSSQFVQSGYVVDLEQYKANCLEMVKKVKASTAKTHSLDINNSLIKGVAANAVKDMQQDWNKVDLTKDLEKVCGILSKAEIKVNPFINDSTSFSNGCYRQGQVALADAVFMESKNVDYLINKIEGANIKNPKANQVLTNLKDRANLQNAEQANADVYGFNNWWGKRGTANSCKFYVDFHIKVRAREQRDLAMCFLREFYSKSRAILKSEEFHDEVMSSCESDIRSLAVSKTKSGEVK